MKNKKKLFGKLSRAHGAPHQRCAVPLLIIALWTLLASAACGGKKLTGPSDSLKFEKIDGGTAYAVSARTGAAGKVSIPAYYRAPADSGYLPVTEIYSLEDGKNITRITIPASVTEIGERAFSGCASLASITVNGKNPNYASEGGILYNKAKTELIAAPRGISGSVTIPGSVTEIGERAFSECSGLTSVTIPASVTTIGDYAFWGAWDEANNKPLGGITSVTIGTGVTAIGNRAFENNALTSVTIPGSVTTIGQGAFRDNQLASVTIPNSVTFIGQAAFRNNQLTSVAIPGSVISIGHMAFLDNPLASLSVAPDSTMYSSRDLFLLDKYGTQLMSYYGSEKNVVIPDSVTTIGQGAFWNNQLTSVTIPSRVTKIGIGAFYNNQLTSVTIPGSVTVIEVNAFRNNKLTSVTIPSSVYRIEGSAFYGNSLTSLYIGANVGLGDNSIDGIFETQYSRAVNFASLSGGGPGLGRAAGAYVKRNGYWYRQSQ